MAPSFANALRGKALRKGPCDASCGRKRVAGGENYELFYIIKSWPLSLANSSRFYGGYRVAIEWLPSGYRVVIESLTMRD